MEHFNSLVAEANSLLSTQARGVDAGALVSAGVKLAARVNALTQLNGVQKRDLVVAVLLSALEKIEKKERETKSQEESTEIEKRFDHLEQVVRSAVPSAIDAAIDASRGKLNLKKIRPSVLLNCCLCVSKQAVAVLNDVGVISDETEKKAELVLRKAESVVPQENSVAVSEQKPDEKVGEKLDAVVPVEEKKEEVIMIENPLVSESKTQTEEKA